MTFHQVVFVTFSPHTEQGITFPPVGGLTGSLICVLDLLFNIVRQLLRQGPVILHGTFDSWDALFRQPGRLATEETF